MQTIVYPILITLDYLFELIWNIRIYHKCEARIEKLFPKIAVWHHKACRVITNGDPKGWIFLSYPNTNNGLFVLLTNFDLFINLCIHLF